MCSFGSTSKLETKESAYELTSDCVSQPACCVLYLQVASMHNRPTQGDAREGNLILNLFFFATKTTKASTVVGMGEESVPCDPAYKLRKGGSFDKVMHRKYKKMGQKNKRTQHA